MVFKTTQPQKLFTFLMNLGSFTNYVTQRRWVGGLQNVTIPMKLEKFYYAKALLEVGGWSKYQKNRVT